jgi:A/G-specific adenine glycosylase
MVETPLPAARPDLYRLTDTITPAERAGDFAQAMMDLGATICTPKNPACVLCPLAEPCRARAERRQQDFPRKVAKLPKPERHGTIFWLEHQDRVLLVRRPESGVLGGMRALPTGTWSESDSGMDGAPASSDWQEVGTGRHVFTHFALNYRVMIGHGTIADGEWWPIDDLSTAGLPTLFARAARIAQTQRIAA